MATKHVFVDYENVKAGNLDLLAYRQFKVMIFLGANDAKIPVELVFCKVQELLKVEYMRIWSQWRVLFGVRVGRRLAR